MEFLQARSALCIENGMNGYELEALVGQSEFMNGMIDSLTALEENSLCKECVKLIGVELRKFFFSIRFCTFKSLSVGYV